MMLFSSSLTGMIRIKSKVNRFLKPIFKAMSNSMMEIESSLEQSDLEHWNM